MHPIKSGRPECELNYNYFMQASLEVHYESIQERIVKVQAQMK